MSAPRQRAAFDAAAASRPSIGRIAFLALAWTLVACIAAQTGLAGAAVFADPAYWTAHERLVHLFEFVPLFMLLIAFPARLPRSVKWRCAALLALVFAQYATAHVAAAGPAHPVVALAMFWLAVDTAIRAGRLGANDPEGDAS